MPIAVVSALFTAWLAFDIGGTALTRAVDNTCFLLVSAGTGLLMARAAGRCTGATRRAWRLLAAASLIWCAGQVAWMLREGLSGNPAPFPSVADAGFLLSLPLAAFGVLTTPTCAAAPTTHRPSAEPCWSTCPSAPLSSPVSRRGGSSTAWRQRSAIVLVGLLAGRQVLTIAENVRLAETVERHRPLRGPGAQLE